MIHRGKRLFGRTGRRWQVDLTEIGCEGVDLTQLVQNMVQWRASVNKETPCPINTRDTYLVDIRKVTLRP
jgi:hypothetical protein